MSNELRPKTNFFLIWNWNIGVTSLKEALELSIETDFLGKKIEIETETWGHITEGNTGAVLQN
jgi:uncharacterized membrane protein